MVVIKILDSKRNAYFSKSIEYEKTLSNFTPNDMNMFEWSHGFAPGILFVITQLIIMFCLLMQKTQKQCRNWKKHDLNPMSLHVTRTQCNR